MAFLLILLCFLLPAIARSALPAVPDVQLQALTAFRDSIEEDPLGALAGWTSSTHHCSWAGVSCNPSNTSVLSIYLVEKHLRGTISPFLAGMKDAFPCTEAHPAALSVLVSTSEQNAGEAALAGRPRPNVVDSSSSVDDGNRINSRCAIEEQETIEKNISLVLRTCINGHEGCFPCAEAHPTALSVLRGWRSRGRTRSARRARRRCTWWISSPPTTALPQRLLPLPPLQGHPQGILSGRTFVTALSGIFTCSYGISSTA